MMDYHRTLVLNNESNLMNDISKFKLAFPLQNGINFFFVLFIFSGKYYFKQLNFFKAHGIYQIRYTSPDSYYRSKVQRLVTTTISFRLHHKSHQVALYVDIVNTPSLDTTRHIWNEFQLFPQSRPEAGSNSLRLQPAVTSTLLLPSCNSDLCLRSIFVRDT